ncbi:MAG: cardiolipin synthase [Pirellula sp.]|nr:cardiolipin synthase [Pirellula sp.]
MLVYVPQRRSPAAARSWLLLIFLLPLPGLLLYALFGRAFMPRHRLQLQSRVSRLLQAQPSPVWGTRPEMIDFPPRFREAASLAELMGEFPLVEGNQVELLPDYDASIERLIGDIRAARSHVHLLYYILGDDAVGRAVEKSLVEAVGRGVHCIVLMDALGSRKSIATLAPRLRSEGVDVRVLLPGGLFRIFHKNAARYDLRNHRKIAVIDGRVGYVGSQNLVDKMFIPGLIYHELAARVTGPVVKQLQALLLADRFYETEDLPRHDEDLFPELPSTSGAAAQVLPSGPGYPQANNLRWITSIVYAAQRRIVLTTPYFIPDDTLREALVTASQKGVEVHLIVSRVCDQWLVGHAQRSFYEELLEAGVHIHLYRDYFLHAKHLSVDDQVVQVGSSNLDIRSFALNAEVSLLVYDRDLAERLKTIQLDYMARSEELTLEVWRRRPGFEKVLENIARLVDSLL